MAKRMTKKEIVSEIEKTFREHPSMEVVVSDMGLRNTRWGLHGYCLCWQYDRIMVRPWSGANTYWATDLTKRKKSELADLMERTWKSI